MRMAFLLAAALVLGACGESSDKPASEMSSATGAEERQATSVRVEAIRRQSVETWLFGEGTARATEREFLSFESPGRIAYVDPDIKEGDRVEKGQLIAYQEKNQPTSADDPGDIIHVAVREARANLNLARNTFQRFETLLEQRSASRQEYDEAKVQFEQADVQYRNALIVADESRIVSPMDGVLARLNIEQGFYFSPQWVQSSSEGLALRTVPVVIIDESTFEVSVDLPSYSFQQIEVGRPVLIEPEQGLSNREGPRRDPADYVIRGEIYAISPSVDPDTRTFKVKIRTTSGETRLQDGSFVTTWIAGPSSKDAVAMPVGAIRFSDNQPFVFIAAENGREVERRDLELGLRGREVYEVRSGVSTGERVVIEGKDGLADGEAIRIIDAAGEEDNADE